MISEIDDYYLKNKNGVSSIKQNFSSDRSEHFKILEYPKVRQGIYGITIDGRIYSFIADSYISWSIRDNLPYVTLCCISDRGNHLEPIYIKDLVAYNFIADAISYLERGFHAVNVDGNSLNCHYLNIRYIDPLMEL